MFTSQKKYIVKFYTPYAIKTLACVILRLSLVMVPVILVYNAVCHYSAVSWKPYMRIDQLQLGMPLGAIFSKLFCGEREIGGGIENTALGQNKEMEKLCQRHHKA